MCLVGVEPTLSPSQRGGLPLPHKHHLSETRESNPNLHIGSVPCCHNICLGSACERTRFTGWVDELRIGLRIRHCKCPVLPLALFALHFCFQKAVCVLGIEPRSFIVPNDVLLPLSDTQFKPRVGTFALYHRLSLVQESNLR